MRRNHSNNVNEKDEKSRPEIRRGNININIIIDYVIQLYKIILHNLWDAENADLRSV